VREEFVSTVDLFATFVSAATGELRPHGAGMPLQPLLQPGEVAWRDSMLTEMKERLLRWRIETEDPLLDDGFRAMLTERYKGTSPYIPVVR